MGKHIRVNVAVVDTALVAMGAVGVCAQAQRIGITRRQWSRIRAGKLKTTPRTDTLAKIVAACRLPYSRVITHH